jgi:hypothetical protein
VAVVVVEHGKSSNDTNLRAQASDSRQQRRRKYFFDRAFQMPQHDALAALPPSDVNRVPKHLHIISNTINKLVVSMTGRRWRSILRERGT